MKKTVVAVLIFCLMLLEYSDSNANNIINPPSDMLQKSDKNCLEHKNSKGSSFLGKIQLLKDELEKYKSSLPPNEIANIFGQANRRLRELLTENGSISATSRDILGDNSNFYVTFHNEIIIGKSKVRLIEFGPANIAMGASTTVLLQSWNEADSPKIQELYSITQGANVTQLLHAEVLNSNNEYYIIFIDKKYGPENTYIRVFTYKLCGLKWLPFYRVDDSKKKDGWEVVSYNNRGMFYVESRKVFQDLENDYYVNFINGNVQVNVIDENNKAIDVINLSFKNGEWDLN
jgi:hypothetical protein